jgi:hypothetical protein
VRGTMAGNKGTLTSEFTATANINGQEFPRQMKIVYEFTVDGDKLEGTMTTRTPEETLPVRPFSAWREKP